MHERQIKKFFVRKSNVNEQMITKIRIKKHSPPQSHKFWSIHRKNNFWSIHRKNNECLGTFSYYKGEKKLTLKMYDWVRITLPELQRILRVMENVERNEL